MRYPIARGRTRQPKNGPNKTEQEYADRLEQMRMCGLVLWYGYEKIKLKLANRTFFTVDFFVMNKDRELEAHEVKGGFWEDDARVKIKVSAEQFPIFRFIAAQKLPNSKGGGWKIEEF
jgi:hypothetical protein